MKKMYLIITFIICLFLFNSKIYALENGIYTIHSAINDNYVLDLNGAAIYNGNNIQLYQSNRSNAQKFKIEKLENGYYKISSFLNDNYLLSSQNLDNTTKIKIYNNSVRNQEWILKDVGNDYYSILATDKVHCIDISEAKIQNNGIIQLYESNNTNAQKFRFEKIFTAKKTIDNGLYTISTFAGNDKVLDIKSAIISNGSNIQQYTLNNTDAQKWVVDYLGNGYYSIRAYSNLNYSLDVSGAGKYNGTNLQLYNANNSAAQQWIISPDGDGYYNIVSKCNNLHIDIAYSSSNNGANAWLYSYNGTAAQKFKFNKVVEKGYKTISNGTYFINSSINSKKSLDLTSGSTSSGTNIQIYDSNYSLAQKWDIKYIEDGYYKILSNKDNNYALTVNLNNNVEINKYNDSDNQKWIIKKIGNYYYIISKLGKYLDISGASIKNGTNIGVYLYNSSSAQKYNFIKTASGIGTKILENGIYRINTSLKNNKVLDVVSGLKINGTNVQLFDWNGSRAQKWKVEYLSSGYYKISSLVDLTKTLDVAGGSTRNGTNVQLYDNNNSSAQQWIIKDAGDGYFYMVSNCNGLYMDVAGASTSNGTNIWMYTGNNTNAQKFKFIPAIEDTKVIDVSAHQGSIDWNKVYNTGIYGVILRIGTWETLDSRFYSYLDEVERLGLPYGIYLFSYASTTNGANIEANFTKNIINGTLKGHEGRRLNPTLGIYYDIEDWYISEYNTSNILSKNDYDNLISTYINNVSSGISNKYKVKVYANSNYALNRFNDYARNQVDWLADYRGYKGYKGPISLWQYTSSATLNGINGYVDMSYLQ